MSKAAAGLAQVGNRFLNLGGASPSDGAGERNKAAMLELFSGVTSGLPVSWGEARDLSQWSGVTVDENGEVTDIVAQHTEMTGTLNVRALAKLARLRRLDLHGHVLGGVGVVTLPLHVKQLDLWPAEGNAARWNRALRVAASPNGSKEERQRAVDQLRAEFCVSSVPSQKAI